ncbi:MAG TPA: 2-amino-4-hydroxy-6-hydroxymethyldihydropteridine diphosphokinase [Allosphingosinicella sp.]
MKLPTHSYAIALGSNRPHGRHGAPQAVLRAAMAELRALGTVERCSPIHRTDALGPAGRSFANAALILGTELDPPALLGALKRIERSFGRRPGRRWGPRVLDLDIILWSGGRFGSRRLAIPHAGLAERAFVLHPLAQIAPEWRVPGTGRAVRHLAFRARPH